MLVISVALTLVIASSIIYLLFFYRLNTSFKNKVEVIIVHHEDGTNMTVHPSTLEGEKLISACENILQNLFGKLLCFFTDEEMTTLKNASTYVEISLRNTYNLTLFYHSREDYPEMVTGFEVVQARRMVFFITEEEGLAVVAIDGPYWGCWGISKNSKQFLELVNIVNSMYEG